jgi:hypothetical protein
MSSRAASIRPNFRQLALPASALAAVIPIFDRTRAVLLTMRKADAYDFCDAAPWRGAQSPSLL